MSDFLSNEIDRLIKRSEDSDKVDEVRFSLTFSKFDNRRIEYVRRKLKLSKQELLHNIVVAAIADIEYKIGLLTESEVPGEYDMSRDYQKALTSSKSISSIFKDE